MDIKKIEKALKSAQKGQHKSYDIIIQTYGKRVYGYIYKLVHDQHLTEDIYQEVWIKVFKNIQSYELNQAFSPWLITIARNTTYDFLKKNKVIHLPIQDFDEIETNTISPESMLIKKERLIDLDNRIQALSSKDQQLIYLRCFEGLGYDEIGVQLNLHKDQVKWQLYEAKKRLKKTYKEEGCHGL